jgi:FAD:protein FMN transferase
MDEHGFEFVAMASDCEVRIAAMPREKAHAAALQAIDEVRRIEFKYSRYRDDSIVSRINVAAGNDTLIQVDDETAHLLNFAASLHATSGGLFDVTSGILRRAWDFKNPQLPSNDLLAALCVNVGWSKVRWDGRDIALPHTGMEIDFGGFGKEYAADRAATALMSAGVKHGLVNLGGDIRVIGARPDGAPWQMGIRHPRQDNAVVASIPVNNGALATSGDYERFFEMNGQRYCHILNPFTGWPVQYWQSISVVAPVCIAAGAASTIAMLMEADAIPFLQSQNLPFLAINAQGDIIREDGADIAMRDLGSA